MLQDRTALQKLRENCTRALDAERKKILVCAGTGCVSSGSLDLYARLSELMRERGIPCEVELREEPENIGQIGVKKSGCHGFCEMGPLVLIEPEGYLYTKVRLDDCEAIIDKTIVKGEVCEHLVYQPDGQPYPKRNEIPFYKKQTRIVLEHCGLIDSESISEYLALGGYTAFEKALFDMSSEQVIAEVTESNLRGRGGAGFPTGIKWNEAFQQKALPKYVVCNGDEGDPGAFMDRSVMEGDPHRVIEGMLIAGKAIGASSGYIYVRAEYPIAVKRLKIAINQATKLGLLGEHILGTDFSFTLGVYQGAGAFVCGEGSALTASIQGNRGMPRVKRFRTVAQGLFEKPTLLNNVETFANVPSIINRGAAWYKSIGPANSPGTKTFALTGNINNTGLIEVPMGTTLGEVIFDIGGGLRDGAEFKAVQIGGPSGACLTKDDIDLPLDFDSLKKADAIIGSGGLVVMNDKTCMVEIARFFMSFTQKESCGKCIPCREGTLRMLEILERIVAGNGEEGDIELLLELAEVISGAALCGLGKTAPNPVVSAIRRFRGEYEAHIRDKRCPAGACKQLARIFIDKEACKACGKCAKVCPAGAISGKPKTPYEIDEKKCIKCRACIETCPFGAVKEEQ
ncbi:MAG: NADH-quinone oxidoreductase subunit NuoF [Spirochaetaceae bacterium]|jgi:NADH-quinone oxidoreductase subunit F|nr:NADH-quinone oxidoreductase subunit NuoF [Spirochaetaceae bacterium]